MLCGIIVFKMIAFILFIFLSIKASISINTPLDRTDPFVSENFIKWDL